MRKGLVSIIFALFFLFIGCSNKKYYEPKEIFSPAHAIVSSSESINSLTREGATLESGNYLSKQGISSFSLEEGYRFLNEDGRYVLVSNPDGILKVIIKASHKTSQDINLLVPVVSATIHNDIIAYVLNDNSFGLYNMKTKQKLMQSRSGKMYVIDTRSASPLFIDNIAVFPMLDGKIIIVNSENTNSSRVVYISNEKVFNNVIFLGRIGDTLIASTPSKVLSFGSEKNIYKANISEVAIDKEKLYLFTKEGSVKRLDTHLKVLAEKKYKFAHYSVATAFDNKVYALDQRGSLIVMNDSFTKDKTYALDKVEEPAYISQKKLYKDGKVIDLSTLGYE